MIFPVFGKKGQFLKRNSIISQCIYFCLGSTLPFRIFTYFSSKTQKGAPMAPADYPKMCLCLFPPSAPGSLPNLFVIIYEINLENARKKHIFNRRWKMLKKSNKPRITRITRIDADQKYRLK